jgi:hypothetical protein
MKVTRKFNPARVGHPYESIDFEVEASTVDETIREIDDAWQVYRKQIIEGKVQ